MITFFNILLISALTTLQETTALTQYPDTKRGDTVDLLHGVHVKDPYRWLEDDVRKNDEVRTWVNEQNKLTRFYLDAIPERKEIEEQLTVAWNYPKQSAPFHRGDLWFQSRNTGLQDHSVIYYGHTPEDINNILIDPNTFSEDGTKSLSVWSPSPEGSFLVWGISDAGSDWGTWRIRSLKNKRLYPEVLKDIKFSSPAWLPDESGFFYTRFVDHANDELIEITEGSQVWFHKLGTPQSNDQFVYTDKSDPSFYYGPRVTKDGGWLVITANKGTDSNNGILIKGPNEDNIRWLDDAFDAELTLIGGIENTLWFKTNRNAPRGKIVCIDLTNPKPIWRDVVDERSEILKSADVVGGKIAVTWLKDAATKATVHDLDGKELYAVAMPGAGTAGGFSGDNKDTTVYWSYSSFNQPPSIYTLDIDTQNTEKIWQATVPIDLSNIDVKQVFVESTDGARVPLFITHRKDVKLDGNNPVLLYGYGGFDIPILPRFSASRAVWVSMGGIYVNACIRGGSEYGKNWHESGMLKNKQQVFDDFISCAEWLIDKKWTTPQKLGIQGGSNGGLLVGACMTQRPDLFGACLPAVGVMDMLRFHLFTVGWAWTSEYGSPDDANFFPYLLKYSPLHNIRPNICYPPTLITTGDTDDRVVPGHSFKFAAQLQFSQACKNPTLIRIETRAGHGSGKPTSLRIEETADIYAFLYKYLGIKK